MYFWNKGFQNSRLEEKDLEEYFNRVAPIEEAFVKSVKVSELLGFPWTRACAEARSMISRKEPDDR